MVQKINRLCARATLKAYATMALLIVLAALALAPIVQAM